MSNRPTELTDVLYDYLQTHGVREQPALRRLREATADHEWAIMQISPEQGALMRLLVELTGATRALEVGVFTGYSALAVALAMGPDGRVIGLDRNADWTEMARQHWADAGVGDKIELRLGDATESLEALRAEGFEQSFDFAFIDADKAQYETYYEHCLALARPGGLIALDNMFHMGNVAEREKWSESTPAVDALNKKIATDERVSIVMLAIGDGLTLCRKRP